MPELIECKKCKSGVYEGDKCHVCGHKPEKKLADKDIHIMKPWYKNSDTFLRNMKMNADPNYCNTCNCFDNPLTHKCKIFKVVNGERVYQK